MKKGADFDMDTFDDHFHSYVSVVESTIDKHAPLKRFARKEKNFSANHG